MENCSFSKVHCGGAGLCLQRGGGDGKRAARGQFHFFCDFKTGKNRLAQAQFFAGRELRDLARCRCSRGSGSNAIPSSSVKRKRRLRRLRGVSFFLARDAHLKLRRHRVMVENV